MLPSTLALLLALLLGALALWSRRGRSRISRWWVRRYGSGPFAVQGSLTEQLALVVLPLLAQMCVVFAVCALPGVPDVLRSVALVLELVVGLVVMLATTYRHIQPLWVYPAWLRPEREAELKRSRA